MRKSHFIVDAGLRCWPSFSIPYNFANKQLRPIKISSKLKCIIPIWENIRRVLVFDAENVIVSDPPNYNLSEQTVIYLQS